VCLYQKNADFAQELQHSILNMLQILSILIACIKPVALICDNTGGAVIKINIPKTVTQPAALLSQNF